MKKILFAAIAALLLIGFTSCSKSEHTTKVNLEYTVWNAMTPLGHRENLHFKPDWCVWTTYYNNNPKTHLSTEWRYKVSGNTITIYLDTISYTASYDKESNTITMTVTGNKLTFTKS